MTNTDQIERLEERFDKLHDDFHKHHIEVIKAISEIDKKISSHETTFKVLTWVAPSGGILGLYVILKDLFK